MRTLPARDWGCRQLFDTIDADGKDIGNRGTCLKLNKLAEAEKVLLDYPNIRSLTIMDSEQMKKVPNGAAGLYLLGQVRELQSKRKEAAKNYRKALEMDPTLWCAYERLCVLEPGDSAGSYFTENHVYIQKLNSEIMREFEVYGDINHVMPLGVHSSPPTQ